MVAPTDFDSGLTAERLRELIHYNPETGVFRWKQARQGGRVGANAGGKDSYRHIVITIDGCTYRARRLAWLYVYGEWPAIDVDHVDRDKSNIRISNLRLATPPPKVQRRSNNRSGVKGVTWSRRVRRWRAEIRVPNKLIFLGYFASVEEAATAFKEAALRYRGAGRRLISPNLDSPGDTASA